MKIKEVINFLEQSATWVNWNQTRDHILIGDINKEITGIGVCWVATRKVLREAKAKNINFIITHENPFYLASTQLPKNLYEMIQEKQNDFNHEGITVYRCHDVWDSFPEYGVLDMWLKKLEPYHLKIKINQFIQIIEIPPMSVRELATKISLSMVEDNENGVYIIGDTNKSVHTIAIGTGAATNVFDMQTGNPDVYIVSEDGMNCYSSAQFVVDNDKTMIVVSHCCCEKAGIKMLSQYLDNHFKNLPIEYLNDGMNATFITVD